MTYLMKCQRSRCRAEVGKLDRKGEPYRVISFFNPKTGKMDARCIKHL